MPPSSFSGTLLRLGDGFFDRAYFVGTNVEQCRLCCSVFAQLAHLVRAIHAAFRLVLLALDPALCFVPLFLLPLLFFLTLGKR